jgi:hypothetical protein
MAVTITSNKKNTGVVIHVSAANASLVIAGNNSVSNVATSDEVLTGAYITQIAWGCDGTGYIEIKRGTTLVGVYDSTGFVDYAGTGMPLSVNQTANLNVNFVTSSNGYVILELQKVGNFTSEYMQN